MKLSHVLYSLGSGQHLTDSIGPEETPTLFLVVLLLHVALIVAFLTIDFLNRSTRLFPGNHLLNSFPEAEVAQMFLHPEDLLWTLAHQVLKVTLGQSDFSSPSTGHEDRFGQNSI